MAYTFDNDSISDLHKDAFGYRPSHSFWQWWNCVDDDEKQVEWDALIKVMENRINAEAEMEREAIIRFEIAVDAYLGCGAQDRATALRWIMDVSDCNGDWEFLCYKNGLPYGYFSKDVV